MIRVRETLGQQRIVGPVATQFSTAKLIDESGYRAMPFPTTQELQEKGLVQELSPILTVRPFPAAVQPPRIPQYDKEGEWIRRAQNRVMWCRDGDPTSFPIDQILGRQVVPVPGTISGISVGGKDVTVELLVVLAGLAAGVGGLATKSLPLAVLGALAVGIGGGVLLAKPVPEEELPTGAVPV